MYISQDECIKLYNIFTTSLHLNQNQAEQVILYLLHQEVHHGIENLVAYLKELKRTFLELDNYGRKANRISPKQKFNNFLQRQGSKRGRSNSLLRVLRNLYVRKGVLPVLRLCNITGRWKAQEASRKDYLKFKSQVAKSPSSQKVPQEFVETVDTEVFASAISTARLSFKPLNDKTTHSLVNSKNGPVHISEEMYAMAMAGHIYRAHEPYLVSIFCLEKPARELLWQKSLESERPVIGTIACLTDDGSLKKRFVANLAKGWQCAISPLMYVLKSYLKVQPDVASFNQDEGVQFMASRLRDGDKVCSIDIVNSTDNIERRIFEYVVEALIEKLFPVIGGTKEFALFIQAYYLDKDLSAFGIYNTPFSGVTVRYNCGQAMGRWTSKGILDFTMLVMSRYSGGSGSNSRINGDDYWTSSPIVGKRFSETLEWFNIPISSTKTFMYKSFGEFSGRLVNVDGILPVYKGRDVNWRSDPFGWIRQYGVTGIYLLPYHSRKKISRVARALNDDKLSDFNSSIDNPFEGYDPPTTSSLIEKSTWDELWVNQVFADHALREEIDRAVSLYMDTAMLSADLSDPHSMYLWERYKYYAHEISTLREHSLFNRVALQRFVEPNQRLDQFIDLLNSELVKTSDGHRIQGYGSMGPIITRLRSVKAITTSYKSSEDRRVRPTLYTWVEKTYRHLMSWWKFFYDVK